MIDLHTHSTASDGTMTPEELVEHAAAVGVTAIALTDHDTVAGVNRAVRAGKRVGVNVIPGIELEVSVPDEDAIAGTCHLLGLGLTAWGQSLNKRLSSLVLGRESRNRRIVERMQEAGIDVDYEELATYAPEGIVARPHIARYLVDHNIADDEVHAFKEFLGELGSFYESRDVPSLEEAIGIIHEAGGKAILAHPHTLYVSWSGLTDRLVRWSRHGLDGVEAFHSNARYRDCIRIQTVAAELGMLVSAGSDFHGLHRPDRRLGRTADGRKIDAAFLDPFVGERVR